MIVFLAHSWHPAMAARFRRLFDETRGLLPCRLLLQDDRGPVLQAWTGYLARAGLTEAMTVFDAATLPAELGLDYLEGDAITPGCTHYPLLWLARQTPAERFWVVESDAEFTGSWPELFQACEGCDADLLAAHLTGYRDQPEWHWWPSLRMPSDTGDPPARRKAFLPVYRISARAVDLIGDAQRRGWRGHYEVLLPTLLAGHDLTVADLNDVTPCYLGTAVEPWKPPSSWSSIRWRPPIGGTERTVRSLTSRPCLLHPIKDDPRHGSGPPAARPAGAAPRVSVVMATHNGAAHLGAQLASLEAQTRPPDEVIIVDDASVDGTWDLLIDFGARSHLGVRVHRQPDRVGYLRNFADALGHATGDLLLFCDQDDVWYPEKVAAMERALTAGGVDVVTHDIRIVDERGGSTGRDSFFGYLAGVPLPRDLCVKGHALGVRASFLRTWGWPPPEGFSHDVWPALVSTLTGTRGYLDQVLVDHRLHGGNASGWLPSERDLRTLTREDLRAGPAPGEVMLDMLIADDRRARLDTLSAVLGSHTAARSTLDRFRSRLER